MKYFQSYAVFDKSKRHRYMLRRRLHKRNSKILLIIGLNPSTADAIQDDPTIRRCVGFTDRLGFGILVVVNLFALRSTNPRILQQIPCPVSPHNDPVGPNNDRWILKYARKAHKIVLAWGAGADWAPERSEQLLELLSHYDLYCFGTTQSGAPRHPLYLRNDTPLQRYKREL